MGCAYAKESSSFFPSLTLPLLPSLLRGQSGVISQKRALPRFLSFQNKSSQKTKELDVQGAKKNSAPNGILDVTKSLKCVLKACMRPQSLLQPLLLHPHWLRVLLFHYCHYCGFKNISYKANNNKKKIT